MTAKISNAQEYSQVLKLQRISSSLLYAKDSKEVGSIIINEGFKALGSMCGDVSVIDPEEHVLRHVANRGYPEDIVGAFYAIAGKEPTLTMEVIRKKIPLFVSDTVKIDKKYVFAHKFQKLTNSHALVVLPLVVRGKSIGCLQFNFRKVKEFTEEEKSFMLNLADHCAHALDRMLALENERRVKNELETILKGVDDSVIVRDPEGTITYVNQAAVRIHGCETEKDMLHLSLKEYFGLFSKVLDSEGNDVSMDHIPFNMVNKGKSPFRSAYFKIIKKTNKGFWFKITSLPITDKEGKILCVVTVMRDVTEEKQSEESKDEFFGIASHELKTPVTSLKAYTQVLKKRFENEGNKEIASYLQKMDFQIDKLTNLIHDLLDVTKIEGGRLHFYNELFEFNDLVEEIVEQVQVTTKHKIVVKKAKGSILFGDKERIGQVIINFLTNAIKYSPENKDIIAKVDKQKGHVIFSVKDFGIGIEKEDQKHVFERFYREKNLKGDTFPGLGLGLYIASEVIKRQHGKIWVESEKGKQSTFFFQIPLAKKEMKRT